MSDTVFTILAGILFFLGAVCIIISVFGVFKFRFVMNRMQCAAIIDTLGLSLILGGLMVLTRSSQYIPKLLLILLIQWIGSPIAAHMVGRLEIRTDDTLGEHVTFEKEDTEEDA